MPDNLNANDCPAFFYFQKNKIIFAAEKQLSVFIETARRRFVKINHTKLIVNY